jgi:hypothetical protein
MYWFYFLSFFKVFWFITHMTCEYIDVEAFAGDGEGWNALVSRSCTGPHQQSFAQESALKRPSNSKSKPSIHFGFIL